MDKKMFKWWGQWERMISSREREKKKLYYIIFVTIYVKCNPKLDENKKKRPNVSESSH